MGEALIVLSSAPTFIKGWLPGTFDWAITGKLFVPLD
jgi:hypothetical protein